MRAIKILLELAIIFSIAACFTSHYYVFSVITFVSIIIYFPFMVRYFKKLEKEEEIELEKYERRKINTIEEWHEEE